MIWGLVMVVVGALMVLGARTQSSFIAYRLIAARARILWGNRVHAFCRFLAPSSPLRESSSPPSAELACVGLMLAAKRRKLLLGSRSLTLCRRGDLNPHVPKDTSPSSWRVCQFRHFDVTAPSILRDGAEARC